MTIADAAGRVVIAGAGIAGAVAACELRRRGFEVWLLEATRASGARGHAGHAGHAGIEALPAATVAALDDLGLAATLARAGAVAAQGFENAWHDATRPIRVGGTWHHVERAALAAALRDAAIERGARVVPVERLPRLARDRGAGPFRWDVDGLPAASRIAIDATGRAARWSRPIARHGAKLAALFRGPGLAAPRPGRTVRTSSGWAYVLGHPEATTVGVVAPAGRGPPATTLSDDVARALGLPAAGAVAFERTCVAHAQWAVCPVTTSADHLCLAVGDAGFAYEPIAGLGVRFAVASAAAAAACCETLRDRPHDGGAAVQYYDELVASARRRHLAQLEAQTRAPPVPRGVPGEARLQFSARLVPAGLRVATQIAPGLGLRLADGELVRWLGGFDLLALREFAGTPCTARELRVALQHRGLAGAHAEALVQWCVQRGVLAMVAAAGGPGAPASEGSERSEDRTAAGLAIAARV